jgi:hypothetical protein
MKLRNTSRLNHTVVSAIKYSSLSVVSINVRI